MTKDELDAIQSHSLGLMLQNLGIDRDEGFGLVIGAHIPLLLSEVERLMGSASNLQVGDKVETLTVHPSRHEAVGDVSVGTLGVVVEIHYHGGNVYDVCFPHEMTNRPGTVRISTYIWSELRRI